MKPSKGARAIGSTAVRCIFCFRIRERQRACTQWCLGGALDLPSALLRRIRAYLISVQRQAVIYVKHTLLTIPKSLISQRIYPKRSLDSRHNSTLPLIMSDGKVTLFDLPSKKTTPYTCWSPNVWKTRLVLNYKNVPYTTAWLEHDRIESTLSALGIPPNQPKPTGPPPSRYTLPAVQLPDGSTAMDSAVIAPEIEKRYPEPSLHLDNGLHEQASAILGQLAFPLLGVLYPRIFRDILIDSVVPWWRAKREATLGCTIEEFEAAKGGEPAWKAAEPGIAAMQKFLTENKRDEGPFILGSQVCYADFIVAGMAEALRRIGQDLYDRVTSSCKGVKELHVACAPWFEKDT